MRKWSWLVAVVFVLSLAATATAGVLSVRIPTKSGIEARFGMVELFTVNWAKNYDFNDNEPDPVWVGDPEGWVRDNYMSHMVYFPIDFVKGNDWRAHVLFSYKGSDFDQGHDANYNDFNGVDYDRWRVERAYFDFKLNFLPFNARLGVGHDVWTLDARGGALVYFDDDPGIRFYGNVDKFVFDFKFARKSEQTDKASFGTDSNRDLYMLKVGYDVAPEFKPQVFFAWDRNGAMPGDSGTWDIYYAGINALGKVGPFMYQAELVYQGGNVNLKGKGMEMPDGDYEDDFDVSAWAGLLNFQVDLAAWVPDLKKFVVGLGGVYFSGDDDAKDDDLKGFVGITNATRFFKPWSMGTLPVHGANTQPVIGSTIYGWNPTGWGIGPGVGGVLGQPIAAIDTAFGMKLGKVGNLGAHGDNPGMWALVGTVDWVPSPKWAIKAMVKYMEWDDSDPIEYTLMKAFDLPKKKSVDEEIGWETDLMVSYKLYKNVTLFGGISALFPGDGIDDINKVVYGDSDSDTAWHGQLGVKFVF